MIKVTLDELPDHVTLHPRTQIELDKQVAEFERRFAQPGFPLTTAVYFSAISAKRACAMKLTVFDFLLEQRSNGPSGYVARSAAAPAPMQPSDPRPAANPVIKEMTKDQAARHLSKPEFKAWLETQRAEGKAV